ncbi:hypothetical protein BS78_01G156900 [Paspalum vaginatum]|nr:hypothetical protein BS78_01G156900 [Paspalum vaginatum]
MVGKRHRSGRPRPAERHYRCKTTLCPIRNRPALLETINTFYAAALDLLPVEEMPALVPRLLKAGLCVGFSDPVSNIIVNTISYSRRAPHRRKPYLGGTTKKTVARKKKALSRAVADTSKVKDAPPLRHALRDMPVAMRSLEALVALEYLRLANADPLAAVRLIEEDRCCSGGGGGFSFASLTTKVALKCAALTAWHPKLRALVHRSYSFVSRMEEVSQHLLPTTDDRGGVLSFSAIETISGLLVKPGHKLQSLAGVTPPQFLHEKKNMQQSLPVPTSSLQSTMLDKIYGVYLDALARLPPSSLLRPYNEALLKAGHCYGPMDDPVGNIVLNTLVQGPCCSLRGLVTYLRICFPMMADDQAMRYLLLAGVSLPGAAEMARGEGHDERSPPDLECAYMAAATQAQHPDPGLLVDFFVSTFPRMPFSLTTMDFQQLHSMLIQYCSTTHISSQEVPVLSEGGSRILSSIQRDFKEEGAFAVRKVTALLTKYMEQTKGPQYELHSICGLNSNVGRNACVYGLHYGPGLFRPRRALYAHINFLARPKDLHSSDSVPILFFAECSNKEDVTDGRYLTVVLFLLAIGRCFFCEKEGAKIVHPDLKKYSGRGIDFEVMARMVLGGLTVDDDGDELVAACADICSEDCIYFDANRDARCVEFLNARDVRFSRGGLLA